jgi:GIY-YIG catalytic domain
MAGARRSTKWKGKIHPSVSNPRYDSKNPVRQAKAGCTQSAEASRERRRMYYTYILRSENFPGQTYVGSTGDLRKRLAEHNGGKSIHTN